MSKLIPAASLILFALAACPSAAFADPVRVMTFNIRYGTAPDGDNAWPHRRELVVKVIKDAAPDILGLQEALQDQLDQLSKALPEYERIGVGRNADGGGEYSAILFRRDRFDLSDAGTFWLSDTPEKPGSHTWGNELARICTWIRVLDRTNRRRFVLMNTHWDHQSQPARERSGAAMAKRVADCVAADEPAIVTGDFNSPEGNPAIFALAKNGELLRDTYRVLHADEKGVTTFNGFTDQFLDWKIDGVFVTRHWKVHAAEIIRTREGKLYPSDHFPVTATVELEKN